MIDLGVQNRRDEMGAHVLQTLIMLEISEMLHACSAITVTQNQSGSCDLSLLEIDLGQQEKGPDRYDTGDGNANAFGARKMEMWHVAPGSPLRAAA